jgi:hypothetical protein
MCRLTDLMGISHTKHQFCIVRPNLCCTTKIEAFLFVWPRVARFFWCAIPKPEKMYPMNTKCTKRSWNIPSDSKIIQMAINLINSFQSKALKHLPKLGFWVWKQTIWQPSLCRAAEFFVVWHKICVLHV